MTEVYVVEGARTPFGSFGKSLKNVSPIQMGTLTALEAMKRANIDPAQIGDVVYGNVIHSSIDAAYTARHVALKAGVPETVPAMLVNRLCGSGLQAVISSALAIQTGDADLALCGGVENMSKSPHSTFNQRFQGQKFGNLEFEDMLLHTLTDQYIGCGMGITAENLAEKYSIKREEQDEYALLSHQRAAKANREGRFTQETIPVVIEEKKSLTFTVDELVKPESTLQQLSALRPSFKKDGTVTAGNASGINDGAVSLVLAGEDSVKSKQVKPLARIVSWGISGVDPNIMGIGPVPASQKALAKATLSIEDMDLVEINEAFASQYLAVEKELSLDREKTNVNGGAIALGHPVGASGSRLLLTLAYELRNRGLRYGLASLCIGGGQGIAMIIENATS
ncbi:acetyl-CoA C-acetyltransferase [Fictibacillus enclensis]|uniref:acetyl-CoA C-acetyltransferase n=1 Tax=Fictibacillus enclensis TaxID=1017270 RepID=A0A0V8JFE9_9BACL|nr:acetyl-CoA C-acetyltransferase [Fictibacillus enclensis]KSU85657.1 beta-ketoadipyl CoA thiolase [Fictibacillus enclensis]SCC00435.1 acetyl-CoA C-acetyltransferase [Fictibacillus enclensis]